MKSNIHPVCYDSKILCTTCNSTYEIQSTVESMTTEVCGNCHPFYTGKYRLVDSTGRVEKFNKKYAKFLGSTTSETNDTNSTTEENN